jgi:hypothetical protein
MRKRYHRAVSIGCLLSLVPLVGTSAWAAGSHAGDSGTATKEKSAKKACVKGDFKAGIDILGDLYVDTGNPTYLFNQGRCYEQNHRLEEAIDRFREYLRKSEHATEEDKAAAKSHIAECEALLVKEGRTIAPPPSDSTVPGGTTSTVSSPPPPNSAEPHVTMMVGIPVAAEPEGRGLRIAGVLTAAAGVCLVGAGVAFTVKERSLTDAINTKFSRSKESSRASYETLGYVSYGIGAAAIVGGATLYYLGWRSAKHESTASVIVALPAVTPESMALVMQGSF